MVVRHSVCVPLTWCQERSLWNTRGIFCSPKESSENSGRRARTAALRVLERSIQPATLKLMSPRPEVRWEMDTRKQGCDGCQRAAVPEWVENVQRVSYSGQGRFHPAFTLAGRQAHHHLRLPLALLLSPPFAYPLARRRPAVMVEDKWIGLALAMSSSLAIGTSFIITKKVRLPAYRSPPPRFPYRHSRDPMCAGVGSDGHGGAGRYCRKGLR